MPESIFLSIYLSLSLFPIRIYFSVALILARNDRIRQARMGHRPQKHGWILS